MNLRERAKWDRHHRFSLEEYDQETNDKIDKVMFARALKKAIALAEEAGDEIEDEVREEAEIGPELQAWFDEHEARDTAQVKRMAEELTTPDQDGKVIVPSEEMEKILEEVMS